MQTEKFYIDGQWVMPASEQRLDVVDPATGQAFARIAMGNAEDVDRAVQAARRAFAAFSQTSREDRLALLGRILECFEARHEAFAQTISREMGAPITLARAAQAKVGQMHLASHIRLLKDFSFEEQQGTSLVSHEPIGVCALITPWNWPLNQIVLKVAPALAAGCTVVLKPSELSPLNALMFAEVLHEAGVPPGVFNLVNGDGPGVGVPLSKHPDVDMVSFTGSTRAGISVARNAADTVKRVTQELGGKSANILLPDADFETAVTKGVLACLNNSGQSCNAPTRMLVPAERLEEAYAVARRAAESLRVGSPASEDSQMGPVISQAQFDKIQALIQAGLDEGALAVTGGTGLPDGLEQGYFVRPTVFGNVTPDMRIAREEIFGPVLCILGYDSVDDAVAMANDTVFGLQAFVQSTDLAAARKVATRLRAGRVSLNYPPLDVAVPFGGYRQSGNGREGGAQGLAEYLEVKATLGYAA